MLLSFWLCLLTSRLLKVTADIISWIWWRRRRRRRSISSCIITIIKCYMLMSPKRQGQDVTRFDELGGLVCKVCQHQVCSLYNWSTWKYSHIWHILQGSPGSCWTPPWGLRPQCESLYLAVTSTCCFLTSAPPKKRRLQQASILCGPIRSLRCLLFPGSSKVLTNDRWSDVETTADNKQKATQARWASHTHSEGLKPC